MADKSPVVREFLAAALAENAEAIRKVIDSVLKETTVVREAFCPVCSGWKDGNHRKLRVVVPAYDIKDITALLKWAAEYGISKPVETVRTEVDLTVSQKELEAMSDAELHALVEASSKD